MTHEITYENLPSILLVQTKLNITITKNNTKLNNYAEKPPKYAQTKANAT